ncbi:mechanosensitive ion channel domain-containing protein [Vreelandella subglaciescola]|uniref:Small conductance mechanosensitive channel n=1 Tax=Vreelandella subglaciescola TaxID=29571 RepID=A0A1M7GW62_9GAMM|nr:mechanosensitive ion channel domain-containing protein [Halomonas subglaciescola]SHM20470.1 small conductance mechanosensitive channel [Halomonas subglaciescola]
MTPLRLLPKLGAWLCLWLLAAVMLSAPALAQTSPSDAAGAEGDTATYATLADLLENDQSRQKLVELLRNQAADLPEGAVQQQLPEQLPAQAAQGSDIAPEDVSLPRQIAEVTSNVVGGVGTQLGQLLEIARGLVSGDGAGSFDTGAFVSATINLGLVIAATFLLFIACRRLAKPLFTRISGWSRRGDYTPVLRLVACVAVAALIDVLIVVLAYVGGNLIATFAVGQSGDLSTRASLFLNAFLVIELIKAAVRMLFSSRYEGLRLLPISAPEASYWNRWIARLVGMVGYGQMVAVPLVNYYLAASLGQALGTLITVAAFIYAVVVVLKNRLRLRTSINAAAARSTLAASRIALQLLARTWHLLALIYFIGVFVITLLSPVEALPFVLFATLQTLIAVVVGLLLSSFLSQTIGRRIQLSADMNRKLPMLEKRLNSYVPNMLRVLRTFILVAVIMVVLNAWYVFDLAAWYASQQGIALVSKLIHVVIILIVALAVWLGLASLIEHKLNPDTGRGEPTARAKTLLSLFRNALIITMITMTGMIVLAEIGINIGPLIAGAGVLGLAIGFGSQKLVQDVITGVFIQIENAMNTGDVVTAGGVTGTAERFSIRSVGIRDLAGTYHIVPFSSVDTVANYMREFAYHVGEYRIAYNESIDHAVEQLQVAFADLQASDEHSHKLLEELTVAGVTSLADSSVNIRVMIMTTPGDQWAVGRAYNRLVKLRFDDAGIEIPRPHTTLYFGERKDGSAPAANIRVLDSTSVESTGPKRRDDPSRGVQTGQNADYTKPTDDDVD